jgi:hypothetical protein
MGLAFKLQPDMFLASPSFAQVAYWADQPTWAAIVLACAIVRLLALVVNGTFHAFRFSPHFRAAASLVGVLFWAQYCLGFVMTAIYSGGAWSAVVAYSSFVILELVNVSRSVHDVRRVREA